MSMWSDTFQGFAPGARAVATGFQPAIDAISGGYPDEESAIRDQELATPPDSMEPIPDIGMGTGPYSPINEAPRGGMSLPSVPPAASAGVVPEPPPMTKVPGPSQAISLPAEKPANSIREYIDLMRKQGQTPMFTNIQGRPDSLNAPGVGPAFQVPQEPGMDVRYNPNTPGGVSARGTLNAGNVMKQSEGGYDPTSDPFQGATDLAMQDAPQVWDMMTGGGVPMDSATPEQFKKFSAMMQKVRDTYLPIVTKRREEFIKLVSDGYDPEDVRSLMLGGGSLAGIKRVSKGKPMTQADALNTIQKLYENDLKRQMESKVGAEPDEAAAMERAKRSFALMYEATQIRQRNESAGEGAAIPEGSPASAQAPGSRGAAQSPNSQMAMGVGLPGAELLKPEAAQKIAAAAPNWSRDEKNTYMAGIRKWQELLRSGTPREEALVILRSQYAPFVRLIEKY